MKVHWRVHNAVNIQNHVLVRSTVSCGPSGSAVKLAVGGRLEAWQNMPAPCADP